MSMVPKTLLYNRLPEGYNYADNSFLKSICTVIPDVPQTLLREHYRCHPKIIGFCNQKFYQNQLVIMTEDHADKQAASITYAYCVARLSALCIISTS